MPLVAVRTADPSSAIRQIASVVNPQSAKHSAALADWDLMNGLRGLNEAGHEAVSKVAAENAAQLGPSDCLAVAHKRANDSVLCVHNPQRFWEQPDVVQAIWNLRDPFKAGGQMLVLAATPGVTLPVELQPHVMILDEPLPSGQDLRELVAETFEAANLDNPDEGTTAKAVEQTPGLSIHWPDCR